MLPLLAFFTGGALLLMLHTRGHVIEVCFMRYLLVWVPAALLVFWLARKKTSVGGGGAPALPASWPVGILVVFMILYLFSSSTDHPWFYFLSWLPGRSIGLYLVHSQLFQFLVLTALLAPFLAVCPKKINFWLLALLLFAMAGSAYLFLRETGGAFLYRDDHPSTLFRIREFCAAFPRQTNYNPYWNGGQISNHPALTGISAIGLFFLPFLRFIPLEQCYTPLIAAVFIGLVPLLAVFSMRMIRADWTAAIIAGILALGVSQFYFLWLLFYGTVGAVFSAACLMPVSAGLFRALFLDRREKWAGLVLIISGCFLLMWPPNAVLAAVLLFVLLLNIRRLSPANIFFLFVCGAAIFLLQWPQTLIITREILQGSYEKAGASSAAGSIQFLKVFLSGYGNLVDYIRMGHPLLIFLGLGGVMAAVDGNIRRWFLPLIIFLLVVVGWGPEIFPGFQLFRMVIPLFFVAVIPAALAAAQLLASAGSKFALLRAAVVAMLMVGAFNTIMLFGNGSRAPYETLSREGHDMAAWIRFNAPEGTRVLFAGATVHGYEGGHVAFLPCLTGREMMACDYYHFSPSVVEYDYPPRPWRGNVELFDRFLDLYNISVITTLRDKWKNYLRSHPDRYLEGKSFGEDKLLTFFRVANPTFSPFLAGEGRIKADFNRIEVELADADKEAVIKYNWQAGLHCGKPAEIFPYQAGAGIRLIGIKPNGQKKIIIRYK